MVYIVDRKARSSVAQMDKWILERSLKDEQYTR